MGRFLLLMAVVLTSVQVKAQTSDSGWQLGHVPRASASLVKSCLYRDKARAGFFSRGEWRAVIQPDASVPCHEVLFVDIPGKVIYIEAPLMKSTGAFLQGQQYIHCTPSPHTTAYDVCNSEFFQPYDVNPRYRVLQPALIADAVRQSGLVGAVEQYVASEEARRRSDELAAYRREFDSAKSLDAIKAFESKYANNDPENLIPPLLQLKASLQLVEYRRRFDAMRDVKDMESFIADYKNDDTDGKVPEARRKLADEQQRLAVDARRMSQQKEAERRQATIEQLERQIAMCERDTVAARQTIARERRIGAASGYENKLALRQAGEVIVACEDIVPEARRRLAEYKRSGRNANSSR